MAVAGVEVGADLVQVDRELAGSLGAIQVEQDAARPAEGSQLSGRGAVPGMDVASYGNLPAAADSVSVVSVSNGGSSCTRTTEVVSQGPGKPPKVTTNVSGNCGAAAQPARSATRGKPIDHT